VALTDRERPMAVISRYFTQYGSFWSQLCRTHWSYRPIVSATKM